MKTLKLFKYAFTFLLLFSFNYQFTYAQRNGFEYWNNTENTKNILTFIQSITDSNSQKYVPINKRIAVFDVDGTILCEKPNYFEVEVAYDIMSKQLAQDSSLKKIQPYKAFVQHDSVYLKNNVDDVLLQPCKGFTINYYRDLAISFFENSTHPRLKKHYKELFYKPMVELINSLLENKFTVYVSTYSQQLFVRSIVHKYVGLKNEQCIGSLVQLSYLERGDSARFYRDNWFALKNDNKAQVNEYHIGEPPIIVCGNSSGDLQMLNYCNTQNPKMVMILDHDDGIREYMYRDDTFYNYAIKMNWLILSMEKDFKEVF